MIKSRRVIILSLVLLFIVGYLYADPSVFKDSAGNKSPNYTVSGQIVDNATQEPIEKAEVIAKTKGDSGKALTDKSGNYKIEIYTPLWSRFCRITASKEAYEKQDKLVFLPIQKKVTSVDFRLNDIAQPKIEITNPVDGQKILPNPTIEIQFSDIGSGIDKDTIEIFSGERDLRKYITEINEKSAVCVVPREEPLELGRQILITKIRDAEGNIGSAKISVVADSYSNYYVELGKQALIDRDLLNAHLYFSLALQEEPENQEANFYFASTRLGVLPVLNETIFNLFQDMGYTGPEGAPLQPEDLDPFHFQAIPPLGLGEFELADTFPNGEIFHDAIINIIIPEIEASFENLGYVHEDFYSYLETIHPIFGTEGVEIDYGDALLIISLLNVFKAKMHEAAINNMDSNLANLSDLYLQGSLTLQHVLETYPQLMRAENVEESISARDCYVNAIDYYIQASDFIHAETDDQSDDLISFEIAPEYKNQETLFVQQILDFKKSLLSEPDSEFSMKISQLFDAGHFYTEPFDLRAMLDNNGINNLISNYFLHQADYTLANFSNATTDYQEFLPPLNICPDIRKDVDYGDVASMKILLEGARMGFLSTLGYNAELNSQDILIGLVDNDHLSVNEILDSHPELFNLADTEKIDLAKQAFSNTALYYKDAVEYFVNNEDPDQSDDLIVLPETFWEDEPRYRAMLNELNTFESTLIDPDAEVEGDEFHLNLGEFFVNYKDLRPFLPQFDDGNHVIPASWPDPTFGGVLPDNTVWGRVSDWGFGDRDNEEVDTMVEFDGRLYAGTLNDHGAQLWRAADGYSWEQCSDDGFGDSNNRSINSLAVFGNYIYAGTYNYSEGAEIWRSADGLNWSQCNINGFGDIDNRKIKSFAVFDNYLYAGTYNYSEGAEIWRSADGLNWSQCNISGFGDIANETIDSLIIFYGHLYAATENDSDGAELWSSEDGVVWEQAIDDGFGNLNNKDILSLCIFNDFLYAGTRNYSGAELWRSQDGNTWEEVNIDEFGGVNNRAITTLSVYNNKLYASSDYYLYYSRGKVWNSLDGLNWQHVSPRSDGFSDISNSSYLFNNAVYFGVRHTFFGCTVWRYVTGPN